MNDYSELFAAAQGGPIKVGSLTLWLMDRFPVLACTTVRCRIEHVRRGWRQGLALRCEQPLEVAGVRSNEIALWRDTAPRIVEIHAVRGCEIEVNNRWQTSDGVIHAWHGGAAMIVEPIENGRRYRCSDVRGDPSFGDIVFTLTRVA